MRGLKSTLFLLLVLVGLGAYIYFVASKPKEPADSKQEKVFAAIAPDKITELTVKSQSGDVTSLKKDGEAWKIVAPLTEKAAESEVSNITSALEQVDVASRSSASRRRRSRLISNRRTASPASCSSARRTQPAATSTPGETTRSASF
jgi:hypothetical protein